MRTAYCASHGYSTARPNCTEYLPIAPWLAVCTASLQTVSGDAASMFAPISALVTYKPHFLEFWIESGTVLAPGTDLPTSSRLPYP